MPKADSLHMNVSSEVCVDAGKTFKLSKGVHILTWTCTIIHLSSFYKKKLYIYIIEALLYNIMETTSPFAETQR